MPDSESSPNPNSTGARREDVPAQEGSSERRDPAMGPMPIVGVGASAGGVQALRNFFSSLPPETEMAFIVVLHLSPDSESNLDSILGQDTKMNVQQAEDGVEIAANHVYIIPPGRRLTVRNGHLHLSKSASPHDVSTIDRLFRSLADDQEGNAVGIVLSGSGTDGTLGLRDIKEKGGVAMVQEPTEAQYDDMPSSAAASGFVDLVLPVAQLAKRLVQYRDSAGVIQLPSEDSDLDEAGKSTLQQIFARLYTTTGHAFANYKRPTVLRRLERRLQLHDVASLSDYLEILENNEEEVRALYKDLLISVTSFFRDAEAFEALEETVIPSLFEGKEVGDEVRVWVAGCATGEEAYSVAMLLLEHARTLDSAPSIQVFATDVDDDALAAARDGLYPASIKSDITSDRLERYFAPDDNFYRVKTDLRETVIFANHNLLTDPPFSNLDLVSCRNVLIYLNRKMKRHVFNLFQYALRDSGYLFLGRSEALGQADDHFSTVDSSNNIFQVRASAKDDAERVPVSNEPRHGRPNEPTASDPSQFGATEVSEHAQEDAETVHQRVLMTDVASVLVNEQHEVVHLTEAASRYLTYEGGAPSHDIVSCVSENLRPELRGLLYQAQAEEGVVERRDIPVTIRGDLCRVHISVRQFTRTGSEQYFHVRFTENAPALEDEQPSESRKETVLEEELDRTREQLRNKSEEYEAANEEMEAANEELLSMNEELQSKNEELETSKEELQSVNEELETTNEELQDKIQELRKSNSALENLMAATEIATLFLDKDLRIQRYTPPVADFFNIQPADVGRPVSDFTHRFEYKGLLEDVRSVLKSRTPMEREICQSDGTTYLAQLRPYRTVENEIEGIVLTFVDITERRQLQEEIVNTGEKVRRRIGQDLHDVLSSDLAALTMRIGNFADRLREEGMEATDELESIEEMARNAAVQARTLSHALVPVALREEHLAAALENLCREQEELTDLSFTFEGNREEPLPRNKETAMHLYRIAREAIMNVDRHAEASEVRVRLERSGDDLVLDVWDDGMGISADTDLEEGLGIRLMKYRSGLVGGTISLQTNDRGGTTVRCAIPIAKAEEE